MQTVKRRAVILFCVLGPERHADFESEGFCSAQGKKQVRRRVNLEIFTETHVIRCVARQECCQLRLLREAVEVPEHEAAAALTDAAVQSRAPEIVHIVPECDGELHDHLRRRCAGVRPACID